MVTKKLLLSTVLVASVLVACPVLAMEQGASGTTAKNRSCLRGFFESVADGCFGCSMCCIEALGACLDCCLHCKLPDKNEVFSSPPPSQDGAPSPLSMAAAARSAIAEEGDAGSDLFAAPVPDTTDPGLAHTY